MRAGESQWVCLSDLSLGLRTLPRVRLSGYVFVTFGLRFLLHTPASVDLARNRKGDTRRVVLMGRVLTSDRCIFFLLCHCRAAGRYCTRNLIAESMYMLCRRMEELVSFRLVGRVCLACFMQAARSHPCPLISLQPRQREGANKEMLPLLVT